MPRISTSRAAERRSVPGMFEAAWAELDGYSVEIERWEVDMDFGFAFKGLPDDRCPASHVGYVVKGKVIVQMADGTEEVFEGGDAYVLPPGHIPLVTAGSEFVTFTPLEEAKGMEQVVQQNMMQYMAEHGIDVQT